MARQYTGNSDAPAKGKRAGLEKFVELCAKHFGVKNMGTYNVRLMRSAPKGTKPDDKNWLSVHATGRAADLGWSKRPDGIELIDFLEDNADKLEVEEIHDYFFTGPKGQWGRGWRCNRKGKPGWKVYDSSDNAGTPGGKWVHVELSPKMADNPALVEKAFKDIFAELEKDAKALAYLKALADQKRKAIEAEEAKKSAAQKEAEAKAAAAADAAAKNS